MVCFSSAFLNVCWRTKMYVLQLSSPSIIQRSFTRLFSLSPPHRTSLPPFLHVCVATAAAAVIIITIVVACMMHGDVKGRTTNAQACGPKKNAVDVKKKHLFTLCGIQSVVIFCNLSFEMFHLLFGWYTCYCAAPLVAGTLEKKQYKISRPIGRYTVYVLYTPPLHMSMCVAAADQYSD